ncbi:MAG TPA: hypothetical protein VJ852_14175 [Gemmatimonadaceae bacterium]|nr:hypothetical protein [Gemmatimonadaceae bacterium]
MRKRSLLVVSIVALAAAGTAASAQVEQQRVQTEWRLDGLFARSSGVEAGVGVSVPTGIYVRNGLVGAVGAGRHGIEGRTDLLSRFSLDPFRQSRWALYGGGGISGRYRSREDGGSHAYLMLFLGVEGPLPVGRTSGWMPAFEVGLGGGARVGVILRRGINARR